MVLAPSATNTAYPECLPSFHKSCFCKGFLDRTTRLICWYCLPTCLAGLIQLQTYIAGLGELASWPRGPMDKASAYGAGDCRSESYRGHLSCVFCYFTVSLKSPWPHPCRSDAACLCQAVRRMFQNAHFLNLGRRGHNATS